MYIIQKHNCFAMKGRLLVRPKVLTPNCLQVLRLTAYLERDMRHQ